MRLRRQIITAWLVAASVGMTDMAFASAAQSPPHPVPPFSEIEAIWNAFWNHITAGDLQSAATYFHSSRRHLFAPRGGSEYARRMQVAADDMAFCRIDPAPVLSHKDVVFYRLDCRRGDERAEGELSVLRDADGVWRLLAIDPL